MQGATPLSLMDCSFCAVRLILAESECRLRRLCILRNCELCWTLVLVGQDLPVSGSAIDGER